MEQYIDDRDSNQGAINAAAPEGYPGGGSMPVSINWIDSKSYTGNGALRFGIDSFDFSCSVVMANAQDRVFVFTANSLHNSNVPSSLS